MLFREKFLRVLPFIIAGILLIAIVLIIVLYVRPRLTTPAKPALVPPVSSTIIPLTAKTLASDLPPGFPTENGAVLQSSRAINPETKQVKILRTTITAKSLAAALSVYTDYLNANGWTIVTTTDIPQLELKALYADKGTAHVDVTVSYNNSAKSNTVTVIYTMPQ